MMILILTLVSDTGENDAADNDNDNYDDEDLDFDTCYKVIPGRMTLLITIFLVLINIFNTIQTNSPQVDIIYVRYVIIIPQDEMPSELCKYEKQKNSKLLHFSIQSSIQYLILRNVLLLLKICEAPLFITGYASAFRLIAVP